MGFSHIDEGGNAVMVEITDKNVTHRNAVARGRIRMNEVCFAAVRDGDVKKGDVLAVARVAGIMAAKQAANIIPLCHSLNLTGCGIDFSFCDETHEIEAVCTVYCVGKTGVEMEALTGASVALLTVYDMCKAIDKRMVIGQIHLLKKEGGKSGVFQFESEGGSE